MSEEIRGMRSRVSRTVVELVRTVIRETSRLPLGRRTLLHLARISLLARMRYQLAALGLFPEVVTDSLRPLGVPAGSIKMIVGSPCDQVAAALWVAGPASYERPLPQLVAALGRSSRRAVVVGANTGFYCIVLGLQGRHQPSIDAVEPWPPALERLHQNLELNGLEDRVKVWPAAAASDVGPRTLFVPSPLGENWPFEMSASLSSTFRQRHDEEIQVQAMTVDMVSDSAPEPVELILIDAEGQNYEVLRGAANTVESARPIIFIEVTPGELRAIEHLASCWRYAVVELRPDRLSIGNRVSEGSQIWDAFRSAGDYAGCMIGLLPRSRVGELLLAADECGLPCTVDAGLSPGQDSQ